MSTVTLRGGQNLPDDLDEVQALFFSNLGEHPSFIVPERRTTGDSDDLGQRPAGIIEIEILDHAAATCRIGINIQRDALTGCQSVLHPDQGIHNLAQLAGPADL